MSLTLTISHKKRNEYCDKTYINSTTARANRPLNTSEIKGAFWKLMAETKAENSQSLIKDFNHVVQFNSLQRKSAALKLHSFSLDYAKDKSILAAENRLLLGLSPPLQ